MKMESNDKALLCGIVLVVLIIFGGACILNYIDTYEKINMAKAGYEQAAIPNRVSPAWMKVK